MKIHFIGGAHEVGGSCSVVEVGTRRILVDAGIKMGGAETDRLPNLARVNELGQLDAIIVTHAHTDHIGALPLVHLAFPGVPVYTTEPTLALMKILLADSLKIMESRWMQEQEIPLYPEHAVMGLLARVKTVNLGEITPLCKGDMQMTFLLSGHVLGACSVTLDTGEGRILFTGDYSLDLQRTVDGFQLPQVQPDLVITEATYGNRLHANRKAEEARLAQAVAEVIAGGGKVLIPAFALGRAQEVILILLAEQRAGRIPNFPIYVDGMVRNICQVYAHFPQFLGERLRRQVLREGNPFFFAGSNAKEVRSKDRDSVALGEPACIVSSSGMLTGGPSQFYASHLAIDPKSAIFITGYQDEESPGRQIQAVAEGTSQTLRLLDQAVKVVCRVGKYNLSAHADAAQMTGLVSRLAPHSCYLVHGEHAARKALNEMMPANVRVKRPNNGDFVEHTFASTVKHLEEVWEGLGQGAPLSLELLRDRLLRSGETGRAYTAEELAHQWFGSAVTPQQVEQVKHQLDRNPPRGYKKDPRLGYLYRLTRTYTKTPEEFNLHDIQRVATPLFQKSGDIVDNVGQRKDTLEIVLSVPFPKVFLERQAERIARLEEATGHKVVLKAGQTPRYLAEMTRKLLPEGWKLTRPPSIFPGLKVSLRVRPGPDDSPEQRQAFLDRYLVATGHTAEIDEVLEPAQPNIPKQVFTEDGRMESNFAYHTIREALTAVGLHVYRCGRKTDFVGQEYIEVGLLAPWLLDPHRVLLAELKQKTGFEVRPGAGANQKAVNDLLQAGMPASWVLAKPPSFLMERRVLKLRFRLPPPLDALKRASEAFKEQTGFELELLPS